MNPIHPRNLERKLLFEAKGLSINRVAEKLGVSASYADKLLRGVEKCDRRQHEIEAMVGRPIWTTREDWELVQIWHRDLPSLVFATKEKLRAACRAAGLKHLSRPGPTRFQMLQALHTHETKKQLL